MGGRRLARGAAAVLALAAGTAHALPAVEKGDVKRVASDVRLSVAGTLDQAAWGTPVQVRVAAGNRSETLDAAALVQKKGRLVYKGPNLVRRLQVDLARGRLKAKLAGVGPRYYQVPLWFTLDPGAPLDFALPVTKEKRRTRFGGKAIHPCDGLAFAPWTDAQNPAQGAAADPKEIARRMKRIARYTRAVRTFGQGSGMDAVAGMAQARGLQVIAGAAIGSDAAANQAEVAALIAAAQAGLVDMAIVGHEVLSRGDLDESALLTLVRQVRDALGGTGVPVTTADTWDTLIAHPAVIAAGDVVAASIQPFSEGVAIGSAMEVFAEHYLDLLTAGNGKEIVITGTGWPSAGNATGAAEPSEGNAALYFASVLTWARAEGVTVFYDAAFDEAWRAGAEGEGAAHWGIATSRGKLKPGMRAALAGRAIARTWKAGPVGGAGDPSVDVTKLPPYGSTEDLEGQVLHVVPSDYGIATYILVRERWWVKPRDIEPVVPLGPHGTFTIDVTTGGEDETATRFAVFLIPLTYAPPILLGAPSLPQELYDNAADVIELDRPAP